MKWHVKQSLQAAAVGAALPLLNLPAVAQSTGLTTDPTAAAPDVSDGLAAPAPSARWRVGASVDYTCVVGREASFQGLKSDSGAQGVNAGLAGEAPLTDEWFVPFRLVSHNLFLGTVAGMPIPGQINTLGFDAGLGCHLNDRWTVSAEAGPRVYRFGDVSGDDLGVGGTVRAAYRWQPGLTIGAGLDFETGRAVPVLPAAGLQWEARPDLTLNLMWPRTALIFHADEQLDLFVAGGGEFTVFRSAPDLGNTVAQPAFNNALGTYRDFRVGLGAQYRLAKGLSVDAEAGCSAGRQIDYKDLGQTVSFAPGPYVQAGLKWRF